MVDRPSHWQQQLADGLAQMEIALNAGQQDQLLAYLALLQKWNRAFNLTAIRDPKQMVSRQLLDALSILHLLQGERILDLGSGPGLPGIPLAIAQPDRRFILLDANGKKTRFMQQASHELQLQNVSVIHQRVEGYQLEQGFDTICSRAFADLPKMVRLAGHLLAPAGVFLAMKGEVPADEIKMLQDQGYGVRVEPLRVPGGEGKRHAIFLSSR